MWIRLLIAAAVVCSICVAGWYGYEKGYQAREALAQSQILQAEKQARSQEKEMYLRLQEAQSHALQRQKKLEGDVARATAMAHSLREQLTAQQEQLASASCSSVRDYASTLNELFGECTAAYQDVAAKADHHASDTVMLLEAWPQ